MKLTHKSTRYKVKQAIRYSIRNKSYDVIGYQTWDEIAHLIGNSVWRAVEVRVWSPVSFMTYRESSRPMRLTESL